VTETELSVAGCFEKVLQIPQLAGRAANLKPVILTIAMPAGRSHGIQANEGRP
jgi:hypothetical protein